MGQSTNAEIAFGVDFGEIEGEGRYFPWSGDEHEGCIESWWRDFKGFVNPISEPNWGKIHTAEERVQISLYFDTRHEWDKNHPLPVELISHCAGDYPMYILAVPDTHVLAYRGDPVTIDAESFRRKPDARAFLVFCEDHEIDLPKEPAWLLFSDWI